MCAFTAVLVDHSCQTRRSGDVHTLQVRLRMHRNVQLVVAPKGQRWDYARGSWRRLPPNGVEEDCCPSGRGLVTPAFDFLRLLFRDSTALNPRHISIARTEGQTR